MCGANMTGGTVKYSAAWVGACSGSGLSCVISREERKTRESRAALQRTELCDISREERE